MYQKYLQDYKCNIYKLDKFDLIPQTPGIYSWHIYTDANSVSEYSDIFNEKQYDVKVEGKLNDLYDGSVFSKNKMNIASNTVDDSIIKAATFFFSPPIYIGISKTNLRIRLNTHKKMLIRKLNSEDLSKENGTLSENRIDTDEESSFFAGRLANAISKNIDKISERNLYVKVFYNIQPGKNKEIKKIEYILNRTYNPTFGRK
ncbi:hypothetical protein DYD21_18110 [Rhodohalobacter sp. SW132]|uniref:hypothetical protein n=1 Tax=Rhodohalobacter sp. SW132 TaxID=2293433 RepID=UPI000E27A875|nr:hypothetical protein [Rhodohalobacter sp. SW132]REL24505.1 hypothetical protein DYD21_18110 [Rhodohalobacter sp. SW132]